MDKSTQAGLLKLQQRFITEDTFGLNQFQDAVDAFFPDKSTSDWKTWSTHGNAARFEPRTPSIHLFTWIYMRVHNTPKLCGRRPVSLEVSSPQLREAPWAQIRIIVRVSRNSWTRSLFFFFCCTLKFGARVTGGFVQLLLA
ncbi:hypothetical protein K438DRAFT_1776808 [Mycena galopus ATCC 62051]|nr:hypothetical protein K438DRAFT_1776808 [Mycena galopus ATCC 62051]